MSQMNRLCAPNQAFEKTVLGAAEAMALLAAISPGVASCSAPGLHSATTSLRQLQNNYSSVHSQASRQRNTCKTEC